VQNSQPGNGRRAALYHQTTFEPVFWVEKLKNYKKKVRSKILGHVPFEHLNAVDQWELRM